jgi:hypothetical protein
MTLAALLEELKEVDKHTHRKLSFLVPCIGFDDDINDQYDQYIVQGSIQRACERREWHWTIMKDPYQDGYRAEIAVVSESHLSDHICIDDLAIKCATSPAEALLAAYIAAVKEEGKI